MFLDSNTSGVLRWYLYLSRMRTDPQKLSTAVPVPDRVRFDEQHIDVHVQLFEKQRVGGKTLVMFISRTERVYR